MPLGDILRRRPRDAEPCPACGAALPTGSVFCPSCGVRVDDPDAQPLHIVDRTTGLFNDRFIRPVLEDELARAHRYGRPLGVLLVESQAEAAKAAEEGGGNPGGEDCLKAMAAAVARTLRDVDTPGVLARHPAQLLALLPDTDMAGTAHAANRVLNAVNAALNPIGGSCTVGLVCVRPAQRFRAGAIIEAAGRSLRSGRPELLGR
ncbi:MAG: diguanylate cyclase domain-containing protein [Candidatus Dormibacterales bacterium]